MEYQIVEQNLQEIIQRIWQVSFGLEIQPITPLELDRIRLLASAASVRIRGEWNGDIVCLTSKTLGNKLAKRIFNISSDKTLTAEMESDAIKEIANVISGNLKTTLPEPSELNPPTLIPSPSSCDLLKNPPFLQLSFHSLDQPFTVLVVKDEVA